MAFKKEADMRLIKNISCITALLILITFISGCLGNSIMKSEDQIHIEVIVKIESPILDGG